MERGALEGTEAWLGKVLSMLPVRSISVGKSPRHGVYEGVDFGWGENTPGTEIVFITLLILVLITQSQTNILYS
jgi:hypothetical protein